MAHIPKLRFKGFTEEWEQRKLGDIVGSVIGGGTPKTSNDEYWDGDIPWIQSSNVQENEIFDFEIPKRITQAGLDKSAAKLVPENSIAVVTHVGVGKLVFVPFTYTTSQDFTSLAELKTDPYFTCYSLYKRIQEDLHIVQGSAIKGITKDDLLAKEIVVPEKDEQYKIGKYFRSIDNLITLYQRKCNSLKQVKKYMLQRMFPKQGEKVPEIRFAGFTGDWEQRKVSEITSSYSGGTPQAGNSEYYDGDIPFIRSGEIHDDHTELFITNKGMENSSAKMVSKGDILYALYGATSGEVSRSNMDGAINQAILAIIPEPNYNADFLVEWFAKEKSNIIDRYLQGGQGNLSAQIIKKIDVDLPSYEEQCKIGDYFVELNNLIALHQRKVDSLKEIKKFMLQNMFP